VLYNLSSLPRSVGLCCNIITITRKNMLEELLEEAMDRRINLGGFFVSTNDLISWYNVFSLFGLVLCASL
jgi:hypothetical protein